MPTKRAVYNPTFGDERLCVCGHHYRRHFDTHDNMVPAGCKYCQCASETFREATVQEIENGLEMLFAGRDLLRFSQLEAVALAAKEVLALLESHFGSHGGQEYDDAWYACPQSEECLDESKRGKPCECGKDRADALASTLRAALAKLEKGEPDA